MARITQARLAGVTQDQWGLLTRQQAEQAGVSRATLQRLAGSGVLVRVAHGIYRFAGAPEPDHITLRAAWLQLAPKVPAWKRKPSEGVVSHRSAASIFGLGHLPADRHDFILPGRRQTRRPDVRLHQAVLEPREWVSRLGLPVTRPSRIAIDLVEDREDPESIAHLVGDAIRDGHEPPVLFADSLRLVAHRLGLRRGDGLGSLRWLLDLIAAKEGPEWVEQAHDALMRAASRA